MFKIRQWNLNKIDSDGNNCHSRVVQVIQLLVNIAAVRRKFSREWVRAVPVLRENLITVLNPARSFATEFTTFYSTTVLIFKF